MNQTSTHTNQPAAARLWRTLVELVAPAGRIGRPRHSAPLPLAGWPWWAGHQWPRDFRREA